ncbi:hypothetical protein Tco_0368982 [Tanacetum coccineum]
MAIAYAILEGENSELNGVKSISLTEAEEEAVAREVHATHARIVSGPDLFLMEVKGDCLFSCRRVAYHGELLITVSCISGRVAYHGDVDVAYHGEILIRRLLKEVGKRRVLNGELLNGELLNGELPNGELLNSELPNSDLSILLGQRVVKRSSAFRSFFGKEHQTFKLKMFHNLDQLRLQLERENLHGINAKTCLQALRTQFKEFLASKGGVALLENWIHLKRSVQRVTFSKGQVLPPVDKKNDLSKTVTPHYLPKVRESAAAKPHQVNAPNYSRNSHKESYGSNDMVHAYFLEDARKMTQDKTKIPNPRDMASTRAHRIPNACTPKLRKSYRSSPISKCSGGMSNGASRQRFSSQYVIRDIVHAKSSSSLGLLCQMTFGQNSSSLGIHCISKFPSIYIQLFWNTLTHDAKTGRSLLHDNIVPKPDLALELGKSISLTEAEEEAVAREVHATHARIVSGPDPEPMQEDQTGSNSGKLHVSLAGPNPEHMDDEFLANTDCRTF